MQQLTMRKLYTRTRVKEPYFNLALELLTDSKTYYNFHFQVTENTMTYDSDIP